MSRNLVIDPAFAAPSVNWIYSNAATITAGEWLANCQRTPSLKGTCEAPRAGDTLTASATVTCALTITIQIVQDGTIIGQASFPGIAGTPQTVSIVTQAVTDSAVSLVLRVPTNDRHAQWRVSAPEVLAPDVPIVPEPEPDVQDAIAEYVADFLGVDTVTVAKPHVDLVMAAAQAYTRGNGFGQDMQSPHPAILAVIVSATARLVNNPELTTYFVAADYAERPGVFDGFTLPELTILNRFRRKAW